MIRRQFLRDSVAFMISSILPLHAAGSDGRRNTLLICSSDRVLQEDFILWAVLD